MIFNTANFPIAMIEYDAIEEVVTNAVGGRSEHPNEPPQFAQGGFIFFIFIIAWCLSKLR